MPAPQQPAAQFVTPQEIAARSDPPLTAGSCVLKRPEIAQIVQDALLHFEGQRYHLATWCIMPNHVHVVVQPMGEHRLQDILHSWKSFTATKINSLLDRKGTLWERESFDHLIRRPEHAEHFVRYTEYNPVAAGLCTKPGDWPFSSCGAGFQPALTDFVSPSESPFVAPRSRGELPHLHKEGATYFITWRLLDAAGPKKKTEDNSAAHEENCGAGFQPATSPTDPQTQAGMPAPHTRLMAEIDKVIDAHGGWPGVFAVGEKK